jgi:hypothetical protein
MPLLLSLLAHPLVGFALGNLKRDLGLLWKWLCHRSFWQLACIALALFGAVQTIRVKAEQRHSAKVETQLSKCTAGRKSDQDAYRKAQADAQTMNHADVARDERRKQELSNETVSRLNADIAELRRSLSKGGAAAPQSHPGKPDLSSGDQPASGAPGETGLCLSPEELLRAAENEERHDRLIDYVEGLSKINPNER